MTNLPDPPRLVSRHPSLKKGGELSQNRRKPVKFNILRFSGRKGYPRFVGKVGLMFLPFREKGARLREGGFSGRNGLPSVAGFTLIEMTVVIAILLLMAAVVVPNAVAFLKSRETQDLE